MGHRFAGEQRLACKPYALDLFRLSVPEIAVIPYQSFNEWLYPPAVTQSMVEGDKGRFCVIYYVDQVMPAFYTAKACKFFGLSDNRLDVVLNDIKIAVLFKKFCLIFPFIVMEMF